VVYGPHFTEKELKILVTGGAGFIASHVADRLIADGHKVAIVDNLSTGSRANVNPKAAFHQMDITDKALAQVFEKEKPDIVNHHAAQIDVRRSVREPAFDAGVNIIGSINIIENCVKFGVKKLIYISSGGAIYGEPKYLPVDENHPAKPLCPYGISKHTVEHYVELAHMLDGLTYTVLRYANVYGPRQDPHGEAGVVGIFSENLLNGLDCTIFGDGSKTRDYVYIDDVVQANILAMTKGDNDVFNIGRGIETTDFEIFDAVRKALGVKVEPKYAEKRKGEIDRIALAAAKAKKILGWEPKIGVEEGIRRAVAFYRKKLNK
jgi:UDP-glucose 4-epimerase